MAIKRLRPSSTKRENTGERQGRENRISRRAGEQGNQGLFGTRKVFGTGGEKDRVRGLKVLNKYKREPGTQQEHRLVTSKKNKK